MTASKVLRVLIWLAAVALSVSLPKCLTGQFQARSILFSCDGSGGNLESDSIKVVAPASAETVLGMIPAGVRDFQAMLRTSADADIFLKTTTGSLMSIEEANKKMPCELQTTSGAPTVETVQCRGSAPTDLELVVRNKGTSEAVLSIGYYYRAWSSVVAGRSCPWKLQPLGCKHYKQDEVKTTALSFSMWLSSTYGACEQAWTQLGVPLTRHELEVPYYKWGNIYDTWTGASPEAKQVNDKSWAMYKFVTNGGLEAAQTTVHRSDFLSLCNLNNFNTQFVEPCCSKLRSAFTDEKDAWAKLGEIAEENTHATAKNGLWEVCRSLPNAPVSGRGELFRFFNSDASREMVASDLSRCYPEGPVVVKPTAKPLVTPLQPVLPQQTASGVHAAEPWEDDGTGSINAATPSSQRVVLVDVTFAPAATAPPPLPPAAPTGAPVAVPAGAALAQRDLGPVVIKDAAAGLTAPRIASRRDRSPLGTAQAATSPFVLIVGVVFGFVCCAVVAGAFSCALSRRSQRFDDEDYRDPKALYRPNSEDQENLLNFE